MANTDWHHLHRPKQKVAQLLFAAAAAILAHGASGIVAPHLAPTLAPVAHAQSQARNFSDAEVRNYAVAVLDIDSSRQEALASVQAMLEQAGLNTSQVDLSCTNTRSLNRLPNSIRADVRETVVGFCNRASTIVENSGLTVERFNAMTAAHQSNPDLAERIALAITQIKTQQRQR